MIRRLKNIGHFLVALAAVAYYCYPAGKLKVIGVTGTDGKTTTATLIYHLVKTAGRKVALISTVGAYIGEDIIPTGFHVTSPSPWPLQKLIKNIADQGCQYLVLEATSHGLDQHRLFGTNIFIAVLTNVTLEHLDYHKTYDKYLAAKSKLFINARFAVLNKKDKSFDSLSRLIKHKLVSYDDKNIAAFIKERFHEDFNQLNATAAIAAARTIGLTEEAVKAGITSFKSVKGRMEQIPNRLGIRIIIDFAHTPNSLKKALSAMKKTSSGKLIAVFGAAGNRDKAKRPLMGKVAAELADEVILTAEDPRSEDVNSIIGQIKSGAIINRGHLHSVNNRQKAIELALTLARKGDTIGLFGKGHEQSMNLDGKTEIPWSDHQAVVKALENTKLPNEA